MTHLMIGTASNDLEVSYVSLHTPIFLQSLQANILNRINHDAQLQQIEGLDIEKVRTFITELFETGYAEMKGSDQECRSVCVTAQGAIEDTLSQMLLSKELQSVTAIFLTPLPTTPLRKQGPTEGLTSLPFDLARKHTLDMREVTVRKLREAGAVIVAAYSESSYKNLQAQNSIASDQQVKTWEVESKHDRVVNLPLNISIPSELVGALYLITDNEGNQYYLPTQGIQAKDAPEGEAVWKKWLCLNNDQTSGFHRAQSMLTYIQENSGRSIEFKN